MQERWKKERKIMGDCKESREGGSSSERDIKEGN